jgi:hypothetical protein
MPFLKLTLIGLAPPSGPGIVPFGGIVSMDGHDVNTVAIKGARDVQWFVLDLRHEQGFWIRLVVGMLSTTSPVATTYLRSA